MVAWSGLRDELSHWTSGALSLPVWWRDDDAVCVTPQMVDLSKRSARVGCPVHLAVIPRDVEKDLVDRTKWDENLRVCVHGFGHVNHAPESQKKSEFGTERTGALDDAEQGLVRLAKAFGNKCLPVFVPPWNRVHPNVVEGLAGVGFKAISTFRPRASKYAAPGLEQINTHVDPVDWRGTRSLADPERILDGLVNNLRDRRTGASDAEEPLGLLTHHLMQDEATWTFCERLMDMLLSGPGVAVEPFKTL